MTAELLKGVAEELATNPLTVRFAQKIVATDDNRVYTPEDVLGERLLRCSALVSHGLDEDGYRPLKNNMTDRERSLAWFVGNAVRASPYLWTEETRMAARSCSPLPRHTISPRLLPQPRIWFTFQTGIGVGGEGNGVGGEGNEEVIVDALLIVDSATGFDCAFIGEIGNSPFLSGHHYDYGKVYPDDYPEDAQLESVLVLLAFLNSPYIPKTTARPSRAARRELSRKGFDEIEDEVTFIVLRRPEGKRQTESEEQEVNWKHRWIVSGHMRAQWYPSEKAHHLIWIAPYLKGPEDAPLLEHAYKVAR